MIPITEAAVLDALRTVQEPELGRDIVTLEMVKSIAIDEAHVAFTIELTTPACPLKDEIERNARTVLADLGASEVDITWGAMVRRAQPRQAEQLLPGVKNIIAVASGKGGVGKSTVSVNLAVALAQAGAEVGLLDADITGPNIPMMLGVEGQPKASPNNKITPLERHGVKTISIQFFVPEGQPIVWRGPLVGGAIQQFLRDVDWGELDYLVIDLPPGTSDAQLTLAQAVPICWGRARHDAAGGQPQRRHQGPRDVPTHERAGPRRRREHDRLRLPALRRADRDLRRGGGERFAAGHGLEYLGGVPLDVTVRQGGDVGVPAVAQREPGPAAHALTAVAQTGSRPDERPGRAAEARPLLTIS